MSIQLTAFEVQRYYRDRLPGLKQHGKEWRCPCALHHGEHDSFAVDPATGAWYCHSQCNTGGDIFDLEFHLSGCGFREAVRNVSEIVGRDISNFDEAYSNRRMAYSNEKCRHERGPVQIFEYEDLNGMCRFEVRRQDCKRCRKKFIWQSKPDGTPNLNGVEPILFNWPAVTKADRVFIVEGEPKVLALGTWDLTATCNPGGAGKWSADFNRELAGKKLVILPDNDTPGRRHAVNVARQLLPHATVYIVELPGLPPKGDIMDWQDAGHSKQELLALLAECQPETAESIDVLEIRWDLDSPEREGKEQTTESSSEIEPLAPEAFYGIAGDFVRLVEPHTEADPAALLVSFLVAAGNLSRNTYFLADGSKHFGNEFAAIVGDTSKGRKGTSWRRIEDALTLLDPDYVENRMISGLSSGEGVIWAVRNEITQQQPIKERGQITGYEQVVTDPGVSDKRLLVVESEFSRALKVMHRETNTLSAVLREAWDSGNLNILTKNSPASATNAHVSIVAHTTADELKRLLTNIESATGFANRFLWFWSKRSKVLPFGGTLEENALNPIAARLGNAARFSEPSQRIVFDEEAAKEWESVYPGLSDGGKGLVGAITSRSEAHAVRIATIYALLDLSDTIKIQHLRAALAVVDYSNRSVIHIFGRKLGDATADEILRALTNAGEDGLTRNDLYNHFGKNKPSADISRSLDLLRTNGFADWKPEPTRGRHAERWYVIREKRRALPGIPRKTRNLMTA